ncbi:hypothetical protein DACRYDRAFT_115288, partial [Dacryopinax primogenitus]
AFPKVVQTGSDPAPPTATHAPLLPALLLPPPGPHPPPPTYEPTSFPPRTHRRFPPANKGLPEPGGCDAPAGADAFLPLGLCARCEHGAGYWQDCCGGVGVEGCVWGEVIDTRKEGAGLSPFL